MCMHPLNPPREELIELRMRPVSLISCLSAVQIKLPLCQVDLAQVVNEWRDVESNTEDDQYLGDICFSLRYVPTSGKVSQYIL